MYIIYKHTQYISILTRFTTHILYVPLCHFSCITRLPANYSYDNNDYTLHNVRKHSCTSVYLTTNTNLLKAWVERFTRSSSFCGLSLTQASVVVPSKLIQAQVCSTRATHFDTVHTHFGTVHTLFTSYDTFHIHFDIVHAHIGTVHTLFTSYDTVHTHFDIDYKHFDTVHTHFVTVHILFTSYDTVHTHFVTVHTHFGIVHTRFTSYDTFHTTL